MSPTRYTVLPDLAEPWPGAGRPAWDAATHSHVLLRRASAEERLSPEALHRRMALHLPGVARLLDAGSDAEGDFTVWESVHGEPLASVLSRGPLSLPDYAHLSLQMLDTLGWLHEAGWYAPRLGGDAVLLLHPAPGAMPVFKLASDVAALGDDAVAARRNDLHRFALLSWQALVGRDFNRDEPDIAGKLAQKRPDLPAGVASVLASALGPDEEKRPADARAMRQVMEMALGAHVQMAPAWMPPPMMYAPPPMQHAWQPAPPMEAPAMEMAAPPAQEVFSPMPAPEPAPVEPSAPEAYAPPEPVVSAPPVAQAPQPKPIAKPVGGTTGMLAKQTSGSSTTTLTKPTAPTPGTATNASASGDAKEKPAAPAVPKPFPWGPLIGGTITVVLAAFLGKIMFYPLWQNWREESRRRAANERAEVARQESAAPKPAAAKADEAEPGKPVELPAANVGALRKEVKKTVTIYGKAVKTGESKDQKYCYLYFSEKPGAAAYLSIEKKAVSGASLEALEAFVGKEVSATGEVSQYQGKPLLKITAMSDITAR